MRTRVRTLWTTSWSSQMIVVITTTTVLSYNCRDWLYELLLEYGTNRVNHCLSCRVKDSSDSVTLCDWVDIALTTLPDCVASDCWTPEFSIRKCFVGTTTNLRLLHSALTFNILTVISGRLLLRTLWPLCHLKVTSLHRFTRFSLGFLTTMKWLKTLLEVSFNENRQVL